ncbi:hypothetical protein AB4212_54120 [Streptomyces sp. 2MCAF27]
MDRVHLLLERIGLLRLRRRRQPGRRGKEDGAQAGQDERTSPTPS